MKTYVITLSQTFPAKHPKAGQPTEFGNQVLNAVWRSHNMSVGFPQLGMKLHTIRENYNLWWKRFYQIQNGKACLSIRQWSGKPYHSKQIEVCKLTKADGIGLQKIYLTEMVNDGWTNHMYFSAEDGTFRIDGHQLAKNDGLTLEDWMPFFRKHNFAEPLAIIHFTNFRY